MTEEFLSDLQTLLGQVDFFRNEIGVMIKVTKHQCSTFDGKEVFYLPSLLCYLLWIFIPHGRIEVRLFLGEALLVFLFRRSARYGLALHLRL